MADTTPERAVQGSGDTGDDKMTRAAPAKKIMNEVKAIVEESIDGLLACDKRLSRLDGFPDVKVVLQSYEDIFENRSRVSVISGGGSGHEPAHCGYVGRGMLTAAVAGDIFASPSTDAVLEAIKATTGPAGCLLIVKNYTGDRLNFGLAAEMAKIELGVGVEMVIVGDDCALAKDDIVGRRGLAGTVFVHKVAGAAAEAGMDLPTVYAYAQQAAEAIGTMGVSLSPCTIPGNALSLEGMGAGEIELGLGIHGERGSKVVPVMGADAIVKTMVDKILDPFTSYLTIKPGTEIAVLLNNLGSTTALEMGVAARSVLTYLRSDLKLNVVRIGIGPFMTALDMQGLSITLMKLDSDLLSLLDEQCDVHSFNLLDCSNSDKLFSQRVHIPDHDEENEVESEGAEVTSSEFSSQESEFYVFKACVTAACEALVGSEEELNEFDAKTGDGDTGTTLCHGAKAILSRMKFINWCNTGTALQTIGRCARRSMGGTSGALYDIFFTAAGRAIMDVEEGDDMENKKIWVEGLSSGIEAIMKYGSAKPGHRTMLDSLCPALDALEQHGQSLEGVSIAAAMAATGAEATRRMEGLAGRSSYVPKEFLEGYPDPGATAVSLWMGAIAETLLKLNSKI